MNTETTVNNNKKIMKTTLIITVEIEHTSNQIKEQGINIWCEGLKEGQHVRGTNGNGEQYNLRVKSIEEI